ncbi:teichoic acid D-Ala incorporation-associated protein DltX [Lactococcus piscium]|nr:teichoic acid D-Ala incorporation-associated protein DltX [Lactococcus carnosus]
MNLPQQNKWPIIKFILQTILYFFIFLALLYFFSYTGAGQGKFIYNEF